MGPYDELVLELVNSPRGEGLERLAAWFERHYPDECGEVERWILKGKLWPGLSLTSSPKGLSSRINTASYSPKNKPRSSQRSWPHPDPKDIR